MENFKNDILYAALIRNPSTNVSAFIGKYELRKTKTFAKNRYECLDEDILSTKQNKRRVERVRPTRNAHSTDRDTGTGLSIALTTSLRN